MIYILDYKIAIIMGNNKNLAFDSLELHNKLKVVVEFENFSNNLKLHCEIKIYFHEYKIIFIITYGSLQNKILEKIICIITQIILIPMSFFLKDLLIRVCIQTLEFSVGRLG